MSDLLCVKLSALSCGCCDEGCAASVQFGCAALRCFRFTRRVKSRRFSSLFFFLFLLSCRISIFPQGTAAATSALLLKNSNNNSNNVKKRSSAGSAVAAGSERARVAKIVIAHCRLTIARLPDLPRFAPFRPICPFASDAPTM